MQNALLMGIYYATEGITIQLKYIYSELNVTLQRLIQIKGVASLVNVL